jgi:cytochrome P450
VPALPSSLRGDRPGGDLMTTYPTFDVDPFADDFIVDPYDHYAEFRDAGPVFGFEGYDFLAVARFDDVKRTMRDHGVFKSSHGPAFNEHHNVHMQGTVVASEPPAHTEIRATMVKRLRLGRLRDMRPVADELAAKLVAEFLDRGTFDAATDLGRPFVSAFVGQVLGISHEIAEQAIEGSMAGFNAVGPVNARSEASKPVMDELFGMMSSLTTADMAPGSIGWDILDAHERGELPYASSLSLMFNFLGPAFDTTINAVGNALWLFAHHPDQWEALKADRGLIPGAILESLRLESPLQAWSRFCEDGAEIDGVVIPPNTRVGVFPGSGNRDERRFERADAFDIRRNPTDHLAFGHGVHMCVGAPLAQMELTSVLSAMTEQVRTIEPDGEPVVRLNNTTRGLAQAPVRIS